MLLASFVTLWAGTAMLLSRLPWFGDRVSLAERLAPHAPNVEVSWTDEVERWLGTVGDGSAGSVDAVNPPAGVAWDTMA